MTVNDLVKVGRCTQLEVPCGEAEVAYVPRQPFFRQPHINSKTAIGLSLGGVLVIGGLLTALYASHGHYRTALFMFPICFALWGWTKFVWSPAPRKLPVPLQWVLVAGLVWFCFF